MEQALKAEEKKKSCYLVTQFFYLAIQGGLIFCHSPSLFFLNNYPTPPWQLVYNLFLPTDSWQMWCD